MVKITEGVSNAKNNEGIATEKRQSCTGSRNRHDDVFRDEIRVIAPYMLIVQLCLFSLPIPLLFSLSKSLRLDHIWSFGGKFEFL